MILSMEETCESVTTRLIAIETGFSVDSLKRGSIRGEDFARIVDANNKLAEKKISYISKYNIKSDEAFSSLVINHKQKPFDIVFVDHLQEFRDEGYSRHDAISKACSNMKSVARALDIPVVLLCQLSRGAETNKDSKPLLSHLKESGDIEQFADVVMLLYRESYYNPKFLGNDFMTISFAKNRFGKTGHVDLQCDLSTATFY